MTTKYISVKDAAQLADVPEHTVRNWAVHGWVTARRRINPRTKQPGRKWEVVLSDVIAHRDARGEYLHCAGRPPTDPNTRAMALIEKLNNGCWQWIGAISGGRPEFNAFPNTSPIHGAGHIAAVLCGCDVPDGSVPWMTCGNDLCVNPDHLTMTTHSERRKWLVETRGVGTGDRHGGAKLKTDIVDEIRRLYAESIATSPKGRQAPQREIAERLGVSFQTVSRAIRGTDWKSAGAPAVRAWRKSGENRGEHCPNALLTNAQARTIRERYANGGVTYEDLARDFTAITGTRISSATIGSVVRGECYRDAGGPIQRSNGRGGILSDGTWYVLTTEDILGVTITNDQTGVIKSARHK